MTFKQHIQQESLDKLSDAVKKIVKKMQKEGKVNPQVIADMVNKSLQMNLTKQEVIARYFRNLGGSFESQV